MLSHSDAGRVPASPTLRTYLPLVVETTTPLSSPGRSVTVVFVPTSSSLRKFLDVLQDSSLAHRPRTGAGMAGTSTVRTTGYVFDSLLPPPQNLILVLEPRRVHARPSRQGDGNHPHGWYMPLNSPSSNPHDPVRDCLGYSPIQQHVAH